MDAPTTLTFNPLNLSNRLAGIEESLDSMHKQSDGLFKKLMTPVNKVNLTAQDLLLKNVANHVKESVKQLSARQITILNKQISTLETKIKILSGDSKEQYPSQDSFKESFAKATKSHEEFASLIKEYLAHIYREDFMVNGKFKKLDEDSIKKTSLRRHILREMIGSSEHLSEKEGRQLSRLYTPDLNLEDLTKEKITQKEHEILEEFVTVGGEGASIFYQELQRTTRTVLENIPHLQIPLFEKRVVKMEKIAQDKLNLLNGLRETANRSFLACIYSDGIGQLKREWEAAMSDVSKAKQDLNELRKTAQTKSNNAQIETTTLGDFDIV